MVLGLMLDVAAGVLQPLLSYLTAATAPVVLDFYDDSPRGLHHLAFYRLNGDASGTAKGLPRQANSLVVLARLSIFRQWLVGLKGRAHLNRHLATRKSLGKYNLSAKASLPNLLASVAVLSWDALRR